MALREFGEFFVADASFTLVSAGRNRDNREKLGKAILRRFFDLVPILVLQLCHM